MLKYQKLAKIQIRVCQIRILQNDYTLHNLNITWMMVKIPYDANLSLIMDAYLDKWNDKMHALSIYFIDNSSESIKNDTSFTTINYEDESGENDSCSEQSCSNFAYSIEELFHLDIRFI